MVLIILQLQHFLVCLIFLHHRHHHLCLRWSHEMVFHRFRAMVRRLIVAIFVIETCLLIFWVHLKGWISMTVHLLLLHLFLLLKHFRYKTWVILNLLMFLRNRISNTLLFHLLLLLIINNISIFFHNLFIRIWHQVSMMLTITSLTTIWTCFWEITTTLISLLVVVTSMVCLVLPLISVGLMNCWCRRVLNFEDGAKMVIMRFSVEWSVNIEGLSYITYLSLQLSRRKISIFI